MLAQDKGLRGIKISVLGTDYLLKCVKASDMPKWCFNKNKGYCDYTTKTIVVEDLITHKNDYDDILGDLESVTNQTVRHELIHAFLSESGIGDEGEVSEIFVDWFAIQAPKLFTAFCKAKAFSRKEMNECNEAFSKDNIKGDASDVTAGTENRN